MKKLITFIFMIFLSSNAMAMTNLAPKQCPSVAAIQAVNVDYAQYVGETPRGGKTQWAVGPSLKHKYDTEIEWFFRMNLVIAKTRAQAVQKGQELIKGLHFKEGPTQINSDWLCTYSVDNDKDGTVYSIVALAES